MADKWIENAFENAEPMIDGMDVDEFAEHIEKLFIEDFPHTMTCYTEAFGEKTAMKFAKMMLLDRDVLQLCKCFFTAGYRMRGEWEKEKKGGECDAE